MEQKFSSAALNAVDGQRLDWMSTSDLCHLYDAIRVTFSVVEGTINQPRYSREGDYTEAGLVLEGFLERLGNDANRLIDLVKERTAISGDALSVALDRNTRAKALIDYAVWCDDGAANIAKLAASLAAPLQQERGAA
jgi:hypothetical protein